MLVARSAPRPLTAGTVASGASIKPSEPGERSTASPVRCWEAYRAGIKPGEAVPPRQDQCRRMFGREALDPATVASGAGIKPGEALPREALDAAEVPHPSTCRAV
jgi:hypothetical protein